MPDFAQLRLGVLALDGAPSTASLLGALAREVIAHELVPLEALGAPEGPTQHIVLVWSPARPPTETLAAVAAWRRQGAGRIGLIGCSPYGAGEDSELGLTSGFDDWVAGRSSVRELIARARVLHRRLSVGPREDAQLRFGRLILDPSRHELELDGRRVPLTTMELSLVTTLISAHGATLSRAQLLDRVWGDDELDVGLRAVDNLILRLRRKLGDADVVVTVRGVGFRIAG